MKLTLPVLIAVAFAIITPAFGQKTQPVVKKKVTTTTSVKGSTSKATPSKPTALPPTNVSVTRMISEYTLVSKKKVEGGWLFTLKTPLWSIWENDRVPILVEDEEDGSATPVELIVRKATLLEGPLDAKWVQLFLPAENLPQNWKLRFPRMLESVPTRQSLMARIPRRQ